jgi:hypothetical protein
MSNGTQKLAKFGAAVVRWRDGKQGWESWEEQVAFKAESHLEGTDAVWSLAQTVVGKKWKKTSKSGWDIVELWMEPPRRW